jgi:predicted SAM-dependent methyltransferase
MGRKLHIGGQVKVAGWEVLDANPGPIVDHVGNARDLTRFPDNSFEEIYASHVAEHFDYTGELLETLIEWHRVLVPGGILYVSVPDLDVLARLFLDRQLLSVKERFQVMTMIFGGHIDRYDYHLVGLNDEFLWHFLTQAGFLQLFRAGSFNLFDDTSNFEVRGVPISLNMVAKKAD